MWRPVGVALVAVGGAMPSWYDSAGVGTDARPALIPYYRGEGAGSGQDKAGRRRCRCRRRRRHSPRPPGGLTRGEGVGEWQRCVSVWRRREVGEEQKGLDSLPWKKAA